MIRIAFFDTKPYDRQAFEARLAKIAGNPPSNDTIENDTIGNGIDAKDMEVSFFEPRLDRNTAAMAKGHDAVCIFVNDVADKETIDILLACGVKLLALRCAGYNNVDFKYASGRIPLCRVPAYSPYAVAEHAMALLLCLNRNLQHAYVRVREFNFSLTGLTGFDLHGKTAGVVGMGKIGRAFASICQGFGMEVVAYDAYPAPMQGVRFIPLEEVLAKADVVSLHCPLTKDTHHMIDKNTIAGMKKGAVLINTSRGGLVDSIALLGALKTGKLGGAALDVYEEETGLFYEDQSYRIVQDDIIARLISLPNVLVTGHQAFLTNEALSNIAETTIDNIVSYLANGKLKNGV